MRLNVPSGRFVQCPSPGFAILAKGRSPGFAILAKGRSPGFAILAKGRSPGFAILAKGRSPGFAILLAKGLAALALVLLVGPARASETVKDRFERALRDLDSRDPVTFVLGLWQAHELGPLLPSGITTLQWRLERMAGFKGTHPEPTRASRAAAAIPYVLGEARLVLGLTYGERAAPTPELFRLAGVPARGLVLGPLPGPGGNDAGTGVTVGKHGVTGWRPFDVGATPTLPLDDYMPSSGDAHVRVGFAFETGAGTPLRIVLGTNGPFGATLDGLPIASFAGERELSDWQHDMPVLLAKGTHWLEISVGHRTVAPELSVRFLPFKGDGAIPEVLTVTAPPATTAGWAAAPNAPPGLAALAAKNPRQAARFGLQVDPSPPSERQVARRLEALIAETAAAATADLSELNYLLGRAETTDLSRAVAAFEKADALAAGHSQALVALLDLAEKHELRARADTLARRLEQLDPQHPALLGQKLLRRFELADAGAALPLLAPIVAWGPDDLLNARLDALEATLAENAGDLVRAAWGYRRLAAIQLGASEPVQRATQLFLRADRQDLAIETLRNALDYRPMAADLHILWARALASRAATADLSAIVADLDKLRDFHHQSPQFEEMRGRLLLLGGDRGRAIEAFDRALELAPQNRELADYRSSLVTERGLAERWAEPTEALIAQAKAQPRGSEGAIYLLERTVSEVFASGLASQFRQIAVRIDQKSAAQRFEDLPFAFTPGEDRLEILEAEVIRRASDGTLTRIRPQQVGEQQQQGKSDGVYTLTAYKVVRFPALEVGDLVHIQLRKDEIGSRNLFGDFFGVFFPLSGEFPKARAEAIVVAPATRKLYFHGARLPAATFTEKDGVQQLSFVVKDLPALVIEPAMPGYGDVAAWASVSTFESWIALATWYRELVLPQIETPPDLVAVAKGLVAGKSDLEARVAAIHRWVVTKTRYVGIEFGIHGFKPYKVAEVVQRGYGDCKDKASLLVAMLRAVDIPADFVLVRTRDLGAIEGTPATLWAFNHAIAYVPGLDLYLDGTAESSGLRELPELDQDAQVMRIDLLAKTPPILTRIPLQKGHDNKVVATARFVIDAAGDATADLIETIHGTSAGRLRGRLQDPTRRDAQIAEMIAGQHPGTVLESAHYENLDVLGAPVSISARVRLPKIATRSGDTLELPLVLEPGVRLLQMAPLTVRRQPLVMPVNELEENSDTYVLPKGARLMAIPPPVNVTSPFGSWTMDVRVDGSEVISSSRWELVQTRISPEEYPAFRRFLEDVTRTETTRLRIQLAP